MKDAFAVAALAVWCGINLWLWAAEISAEVRFVRSLLLGGVGYAGFFGYLKYRHRA
jgi:hypothetical protein